MQSEHPIAVSRNLRVAAETCANLRANEHAKPDTRRFAGIFPPQVPEAVSTDRGDATDEEEHDENSDDPSLWEFVATLDKSTSTAQIASVASVDESSTLSAAQQVIASYRAVPGNDHAPGCPTAEINEKELPRIPDDQRSMYTLATSADVQSTIDMMWRPKPKVHMHRTDQRALIQAQSQAIAMMHNAGLKPTNKIQCRRRGCADILPDVEALKYHLHIHNIADATVKCNATSPSTARQPSLVEYSTSSKVSKRNHSRSKTSLRAQHKHSTTHSPPRKPSASSLLPSLFSPREGTPEVQHVPSIAAVSKAFVSDPSPSKLSGPLPVRNNYVIPSMHNSTPTRGRRTRKESMTVSVGTECSPSIAMLLSPPSSPEHGRLAPTPHTSSPMLLVLNSATKGENDNRVFVPNEGAHSVSEKLTGSRSPTRALSPARAMSPIRNGIRRVFSIGRSDDFTNE